MRYMYIRLRYYYYYIIIIIIMYQYYYYIIIIIIIIMYQIINHKGNWLGTFLNDFWIEQRKID